MQPISKAIQFSAAVLLTATLWGCGSSEESESTSDASASTNPATENSEAPTAAVTNTSVDTSASNTPPADPIQAEAFPKPDAAGEPIYTAETNTIMFHQTGKVEEQAKFYDEQLAAIGWNKQPSSEIVEGVAFLDFVSGDKNITVTINSRGDKITTIAQGNGLVVPEELDIINEDDEFSEGE